MHWKRFFSLLTIFAICVSFVSYFLSLPFFEHLTSTLLPNPRNHSQTDTGKMGGSDGYRSVAYFVNCEFGFLSGMGRHGTDTI